MAVRLITTPGILGIGTNIDREQLAFKQHISTITPKKAKTRVIRKDYSEHLNRTDDKILPLEDR